MIGPPNGAGAQALAQLDNMALWRSVFTTDPSAVKPITGKQYRGNSPKPYWLVQRATETFGPCGIGWGVVIDSERFERLTETDVLHVAQVTVWYRWEGQRGEVQQMGQTKASYKTAAGALLVDEDAPKKSITDAMTKCLSLLGFAGDIFSGRWDDSGYVAHAAAEWNQARDQPPAPPLPPSFRPAIITEAQHKRLEARINELGLDRSRVKAWVQRAWGTEHLDQIPRDQYDTLDRRLALWAAGGTSPTTSTGDPQP